MRTDLSRQEMIQLVSRICNCEGTEAEIDADIQLFLANCKHPDGTDLIFWPHGFPHDPAKPEPTIEEIVDKAMNYHPPWKVIADLWSCLKRIRSLRFVAQSENAGGWNGQGIGQVVVETPAANIITLNEAGSWQTTDGKKLDFRNVFRWTVIDSEHVRLEHLRLGPDHPVHLFDLAPKSESEWVSSTPHVCRDDCYSAELHLEENGMRLHWTVIGPQKQESINYEYRW